MRRSSIVMLLATVVGVAACTEAGAPVATPMSPTAAAAAVTVTVAEINGPYSFFPSPAAVEAGQTLLWRNLDTVTHHVVFDESVIDTGTLAPGTLSQPFTIDAGTWNYHCSIHPSMVGTLSVR